MKLLIRISGILTIFVIVAITLVHLINMNIIINEMNNVSAIGVIQAQNYAIDVLQSNMVSVSDGVYLDSPYIDEKESEKLNKAYKQVFIDYFNYSITNSGIYNLDVKTDIEKGIIYVKIHCLKYPYIKDLELVNIVRYKTGYQKAKIWSSTQFDKPDSKYVKEVPVTVKDAIPINLDLNYLVKNTNWPKEVYTWQFDEDTKINKFDVSIFAYISTGTGMINSYWYPGLKVSYLDTDGNWQELASKGENNYSGQTRLKAYTDIKTKKLKLEVTCFKPNNGYITKIDRMTDNNSAISYEKIGYQYVIDWESEVVNEYTDGARAVCYGFNYRYKDIDDINLEDLR